MTIPVSSSDLSHTGNFFTVKGYRFCECSEGHKTSLGKEQLEDRNKQGNSMLRYRFLFHG
ncbi:hypothetical protein Plhal710r2_c081g0180451 [Plasmopara halstedii]